MGSGVFFFGDIHKKKYIQFFKTSRKEKKRKKRGGKKKIQYDESRGLLC